MSNIDTTQVAHAFEQALTTVMDEQVIYRPSFAKLTGSVTSAILLERIRYYASKLQRDFYKFNSACDHDLYKEGDSWEEELGFTRYEFETARKKIATRVGKGDDKSALMQPFDVDGNLAPKERIILYWRDKNNLMWYRFNEALYIAYMIKLGNPEIPNVEIQHYLVMRQSNITYVMGESNITLFTENTTEITTENIPQTPLSQSGDTPAPKADDKPMIDDDLKEVAELFKTVFDVTGDASQDLQRLQKLVSVFGKVSVMMAIEKATGRDDIPHPFGWLRSVCQDDNHKQAVKKKTSKVIYVPDGEIKRPGASDGVIRFGVFDDTDTKGKTG